MRGLLVLENGVDLKGICWGQQRELANLFLIRE